MIRMQSIKEDEAKNGSYAGVPKEIPDKEEEASTTEKPSSDILNELELGTGECTCSCQLYCNTTDVPSSSSPNTTSITIANNNGDLLKKRKSLWSRSQHSRRLKMVVPGKNGGGSTDDVLIL